MENHNKHEIQLQGALPCLRESRKEQEQLGELIVQCFDTLKTYGKTTDQLANMVAIFAMVLGKYPYQKVREGFMKYMENNSEMPAPADIIKLIDPNKDDSLERWLKYSNEVTPCH